MTARAQCEWATVLHVDWLFLRAATFCVSLLGVLVVPPRTPPLPYDTLKPSVEIEVLRLLMLVEFPSPWRPSLRDGYRVTLRALFSPKRRTVPALLRDPACLLPALHGASRGGFDTTADNMIMISIRCPPPPLSYSL